MTTKTPIQSLVIIALDTAEPRDYAIELAGQLGPAETPELLGLFVESTELLEHASSRLAREILLTGSERAFDRSTLERQLRAQAARARAHFEAASTRLGLRHRFEVARGDILLEPFRRAAGAQALVVSLARILGDAMSPARLLQQLLEAGPPVVLLAREGWLRGQSIAVVVDDSAEENVVLDAAARVARHTGSPLAVLLRVSDSSDRERLARRIEEALRTRGINKSNIMLLGETAQLGISQAARACRARLLVLPAPSRIEETGMMEALLHRFSGALLLVRP